MHDLARQVQQVVADRLDGGPGITGGQYESLEPRHEVKGQLADEEIGPVAWTFCVGSFSQSKPLLCSLIAFSMAACCKCHTTTAPADGSSSLVTVAWYFQYTPNDSWDYDEVGIHMLHDTTLNGKSQNVVTHFARNGFFYTRFPTPAKDSVLTAKAING